MWPFGTPGQLSDKPLTSHEGEVRKAVFVRKHGTVISGGANGMVQVWDPSNGQRRFQMRSTHEGSLTTLSVDEAGDRLLTCSDGGEVVAWTVHNGQHLLTIDTCADITAAVRRRRGSGGPRPGLQGGSSNWTTMAGQSQGPSGQRFISDLCFASVSSSQE